MKSKWDVKLYKSGTEKESFFVFEPVTILGKRCVKDTIARNKLDSRQGCAVLDGSIIVNGEDWLNVVGSLAIRGCRIDAVGFPRKGGVERKAPGSRAGKKGKHGRPPKVPAKE